MLLIAKFVTSTLIINYSMFNSILKGRLLIRYILSNSASKSTSASLIFFSVYNLEVIAQYKVVLLRLFIISSEFLSLN